MKKKNARDYECYNSYEGYLRDIRHGGGCAMRAPRYEEKFSTRSRRYVKRLLFIMFNIFFIFFILIIFAGLLLIFDAIHVSNWGGTINILNHQISLNGAFVLGIICIFGGFLISYVFYNLAEKMRGSEL